MSPQFNPNLAQNSASKFENYTSEMLEPFLDNEEEKEESKEVTSMLIRTDKTASRKKRRRFEDLSLYAGITNKLFFFLFLIWVLKGHESCVTI